MAAKKAKRELLGKKREGGFTFHIYENDTDVYKGQRHLGTIIGMRERSGRHCFRLGIDMRRKPRKYRGRVKAATALLIIDDLKAAAKKNKWSLDELVIHAWDGKPEASPRQED